MLTYKTTNYKSADQYERPLMKRTQIQYYVVIDLLNTGKKLLPQKEGQSLWKERNS